MAAPNLSVCVKVIIRDRTGRVLLLKRSDSSGLGRWDLPEVDASPGDAFAGTVRRRIRSETGLSVEPASIFGTCESQMAGTRVTKVVVEAALSSMRLPPASRARHRRQVWVAPDQLAEMDLAPEVRRLASRYVQDLAACPRPGVRLPNRADGPKVPFAGLAVTPASLVANLRKFKKCRKGLERFARYLEDLLKKQTRRLVPLAEVSARAKDVESFASKLIKRNKYTDPLREVTDLVGARIVVHLASEVATICHWIEQAFEVDWANSGDKLKDLGADRFGYRSVHYVVEMRDGKPAGAPRGLIGGKAEIQVRTIAQHAWADIGHDRVYKSDCELPDYWKREANRISALLEAADAQFARLVRGAAAYKEHIRHFPNEDEARRQIALWDAARRTLSGKPGPTLRVARIALELHDWKKAIEVVDRFRGAPSPELLTLKGYAMCRMAGRKNTRLWRQGVPSRLRYRPEPSDP